MHRLNLFNPAEHLLVLFTATAPPVRLPRRHWLLNSSLCTLLHRRVMDPSSPAASEGTDDFVHLGEGDQIPGGNDETLPENEGGSDDSSYAYERKVLPPELSKSVVSLTCESAAAGGVCDVYLVGTAHVSTVIL